VIPTRAGIFTLCAPLVLGLAAMTSSNNLLFMLLGASLGLILLSGVLSERALRSVRVDVVPLGPAYAGAPTKLLVVLEREGFQTGDAPLFGIRVREARRRRVPADREPFGALDVLLAVFDGPTGRVIGERRFPERGYATLRPCELITIYPVALLTKLRDLPLEATVLVRPRQVEVPAALAAPAGAIADGAEDARRGLGIDVYGLRERHEWDPVQRIHALRSLRLEREVVIETEALRRPVAWLGLANLRSDPEAFERAIEIAAATLVEWERRGYATGLLTGTRVFEPGVSSVDEMLDALAETQPVDQLSSLGAASPLWLVPEGARFPDEVLERSAGVVVIDSRGELHRAAGDLEGGRAA
jgi:uncharacterized protein (DUF58 family)